MTPLNSKFIEKFNEALEELKNDPLALSTFTLTMTETLNSFAKENGMKVSELLRRLAKIQEEQEARIK